MGHTASQRVACLRWLTLHFLNTALALFSLLEQHADASLAAEASLNGRIAALRPLLVRISSIQKTVDYPPSLGADEIAHAALGALLSVGFFFAVSARATQSGANSTD